MPSIKEITQEEVKQEPLSKKLLDLSLATFVLLIGSLIAMGSHLYAHTEQDFRFTILGFMGAIFGGMYYGLQVPSKRKLQKTPLQ